VTDMAELPKLAAGREIRSLFVLKKSSRICFREVVFSVQSLR